MRTIKYFWSLIQPTNEVTKMKILCFNNSNNIIMCYKHYTTTPNYIRILSLNQVESESYWNILNDQTETTQRKLKRIPTDLLEEATKLETKLNNKIIGDETGPAFAKYY